MVKAILERLGYKPESAGSTEWLRMRALYRNSNSSSLAVNTKTGWYNDFVTGQQGPLFKLVMLTLDVSEEEARKFLYGNYIDHAQDYELERKEEKLKQEKFFSKDFLDDLLPSYGFYNNKGISSDTIKTFDGGVKTYGKLNNRFVFPVYDFNKKIIGISGRELFVQSERPKWKILGRKNNFIYPHHLTGDNIGITGEVILVESIGDGLALYEAGIKNFLVLFGLSISKSVILYLIRQNVQKIVIATNNDFQGEDNRGQVAAKGIEKQLLKFFRPESILISLPFKKDFGDMSSKEIQEWSAANFKKVEKTV